jgi:hypothetical protein
MQEWNPAIPKTTTTVFTTFWKNRKMHYCTHSSKMEQLDCRNSSFMACFHRRAMTMVFCDVSKLPKTSSCVTKVFWLFYSYLAARNNQSFHHPNWLEKDIISYVYLKFSMLWLCTIVRRWYSYVYTSSSADSIRSWIRPFHKNRKLGTLHYPSHGPTTVGKYGTVGTRQG